jgi:Mn2+/Fe2+ NRAMP family transporter
MTHPRHKRRPLWHYFGPGLICGASENDPTTVASLAVIGSSTIYGLGWLVVLVVPMLATVQMLSAHVGAVGKRSLEDLTRKHYGRAPALIVLLSVISVTLVTLVADLEGGGAALQVLTGLNYRIFVFPLTFLALALLIFGDYERIKKFLVVLPLAFLAYPVAMVMAHPDWHQVLLDTFVPHFQTTKDFTDGAIALLGTTLTSYSYVWQTIETAKERPPLARLGLVQADATLGTVVAGISFWSIVIATGATLGMHHQSVETADQAARALEPLAGKYAGVLFGIGLLGSAMIAVPILCATSAYMLGGMFGWNENIDEKYWRAPRFYGSMVAVAFVASVLAVLGVQPIKVLFASSIIGGVATPVTLVVLLLIARDKRIMHEHKAPVPLTIAGWTTAAIVTAAACVFLWTNFVHPTN